MSINFTITREELEKALRLLDHADAGGFVHSVAVLELTQAGSCIGDCRASSDGSVLLKGHPTDANQDWGRCREPQNYVLENNRPVYYPKPKAPQ